MSAINLGREVSLQEFARAVIACGKDVSFIAEGEMGIGKSAMLKVVGAAYPTHIPVYLDCTLLDLGDIALPFTVDENGIRVTKFAPNGRFQLHHGKPVIIMLDEIGKAMKAVKNALLPLMNGEKRIGDAYLHPDSIVFGTTNKMSEGIGDILEAHARNRLCVLPVRKPTADEWVEEFAINADIAPEVIAWVKQFPHALASFTDESQKDNPYINHPGRAGQGAVVTPRSLEKASHIVKMRTSLGEALTISTLAGTIGEAAARDMQAFLTIADKLATWDSIIASPKSAKLPDDPVAKCIAVFGAISRVDKDTLDPFMDYIERMEGPWQALFAKSIMKSGKQSFCITNRKFKDWALKNQWMF